MDIRFLKGLTSNVGYLFPKHQITLSPTPATSTISIGIGQIIRNNPIYVPVHGLNSPYHIKKLCQYGGSSDGVQSNDLHQANQPIQTSEAAQLEQKTHSKDNIEASKPVEINQEVFNVENSKKRKITESIEASFQHPIIKTKTLLLNKTNNRNKKNYKFRIID